MQRVPGADLAVPRSDGEHPAAMLLVGRDIPLLVTFKILLRAGDRVAVSSSVRGVLRRLARRRPVIAMIDDSIELPDIITVVERLRRRGPCSLVLACEQKNVDLLLRERPFLEPTAILVKPLDVPEALERLAFVASECGVDLAPAALSHHVSRAVAFLARESRGLSLRAIAMASGISTGHLSELFHAQVGVTVHEYITILHLEIARELLVATTYKLERIADEVGFSDGPHLARVFRSRFGCSPGVYRQKVLNGTADEGIFLCVVPVAPSRRERERGQVR